MRVQTGYAHGPGHNVGDGVELHDLVEQWITNVHLAVDDRQALRVPQSREASSWAHPRHEVLVELIPCVRIQLPEAGVDRKGAEEEQAVAVERHSPRGRLRRSEPSQLRPVVRAQLYDIVPLDGKQAAHSAGRRLRPAIRGHLTNRVRPRREIREPVRPVRISHDGRLRALVEGSVLVQIDVHRPAFQALLIRIPDAVAVSIVPLVAFDVAPDALVAEVKADDGAEPHLDSAPQRPVHIVSSEVAHGVGQ